MVAAATVAAWVSFSMSFFDTADRDVDVWTAAGLVGATKAEVEEADRRARRAVSFIMVICFSVCDVVEVN